MLQIGKKYRVVEEKLLEHASEMGVPEILVYLSMSDLFGREFTVDDEDAVIEDGEGYALEDFNVHHRWVEEI